MSIHEEIKELKYLAITGFALIDFAESISDGGKFELNNKRWVIRPKNFVTLQPHWKQTLNIAISLRGNPHEFAELTELPLKEGMSGYSECKVTLPTQLAAATFYIRRAKELYTKGNRRIQKQQILKEI
ncbi:hypothetical protein GCM10009133_12490 [Cocleimonas flava]|uniref:Uncharacterized protein n=1 Tax=Cocleimonas flava TaxID=634765 RepID=A0A4R1F4U4_9GAMM|nr:hypothetical protein [Cocleimonas flava]TCJ87614.1 hypothetical protein EV695_2126 [Cocleimonas flava]